MPPRQTKHNSSPSFYLEELREQQVSSTTPTTTRDPIFTPRHAACLLADIPMARQLQRTALAPPPPALFFSITRSAAARKLRVELWRSLWSKNWSKGDGSSVAHCCTWNSQTRVPELTAAAPRERVQKRSSHIAPKSITILEQSTSLPNPPATNKTLGCSSEN
jgi:hypothetical protein